MYCCYQDREELDDELYGEDEDLVSEGSEVNSEIEFQLYSQLHYSSNASKLEDEKEDGGGSCPPQGIVDAEVGAANQRGSELHHPMHIDLPKTCTGAEHKRKREEKKVGQRSSAFEEVIIIDSGTEVITVSDGDSDDGVCDAKASKAMLRTLQGSTPVRQKRKRSPSLDSVVILDSEIFSTRSESKGSGTDSESDSDGLENWMILGRGNQEGDQSISLNLEGQGGSSSEGDCEAEGSWTVSHKDREAQISNRDKRARLPVRRLQNRYYTDKNVTCRDCNRTGHLSKNCPNPKKEPCCFLCGTPGHQALGCPSLHCKNCHLPGHMYKSCCDRAPWHKQCRRCGMRGHFLDACPEIWRQYHSTTEAGPIQGREEAPTDGTNAYCYNCSKKGHFGHDCTMRRMFNGTYATTPYIHHYDTKMDIKNRERRIKLKVKELQEAGLFPSNSQTALTPGRPKKKQKTKHHNSSNHLHHTPHHFTHTPHQNSKAHKPSKNHIRFNEEHHWSASTPKTKMVPKQGNSGSTAKVWKPKREVPTSKAALPLAKPIKPGRNKPVGYSPIKLEEFDDFPRGGGEEKRGKKKKKKNHKNVAGHPGDLFNPSAHTPGHTPDHLFRAGSACPLNKKKKFQARQRKRNKANKASSDMYPADENLFIIKQKKRRR